MKNNTEKPIIKALCIGGAGLRTAKHLLDEPDCEIKIYGVDSSCNTLTNTIKGKNGANIIEIGKQLFQGLGAGGNAEKAREAAEADFEKIRTEIYDAEIVFLIAGLGGGMGTGATLFIARMLKKMGIFTIGVVTLPFVQEPIARQTRAAEGLKELKRNADLLFPIDLNDIEGLADIPFPDKWNICESFLCGRILEIEKKVIGEHGNKHKRT